MGDGPALAALQQGVMVADSTYMFTPSAMLPAPQTQLVDYQWQRRMAQQSAEAEQGGDPLAASKVLGYPVSLMKRLVEHVHEWVHRHRNGHVDWAAVAASMFHSSGPASADGAGRLEAGSGA